MDINDPTYQAGINAVSDSMEPMAEEPIKEEVQSNDMIVDGEIRSMILTRKEASRISRQERKEKWDICWNHYRQKYDATNKENWQSTMFMPASPKVAEVITSNMHSVQMGPARPIEYQARRPEYENEINDVNEIIAVDFEKSQFKVHWTDFLRSICIIGTGIAKIEYVKEKAFVTVKERYQELGIMGIARKFLNLPQPPQETVTVKEMLVKDYATFRYVDRYDIYEEPGCTDFSKDRWVIEEGKISNAKLVELANNPDPVVGLKNLDYSVMLSNPRTLDPNSEKIEQDIANDEINKTTAYMEPDQEHVLDEYWGPCPIWMIKPELFGQEQYKYEMVQGWFWLIDGVHVVRKQITPWRDAEPPYVKGVYIRVPGRFDGIGPLELMKGLQIELNEETNCRQDEINLKLNKPIAVIKDMVNPQDWTRLIAGPGAIWPFTNSDDVRKAIMELNYNADLGDSWRHSIEIMNEIQEVTAAVKATIGTGGGEDQAGGDTFRGQLLNHQTASERFMMYARILEITGLGSAFKKFYQRIYQFKGIDEIMQILGPKRAAKFKFNSPEELEMKARINANGVTSTENKGVRLAQMAEEFKMFQAFPWFKQVEAARRMVIERGEADPDTVIFSDEELKQFNQVKQELIKSSGAPGAIGLPNQPTPPPGGPQSPIAGENPGPQQGMPEVAQTAQGPGSAPVDLAGRPLS